MQKITYQTLEFPQTSSRFLEDAFNHNLSPHTCIMWNNEKCNKSLFLNEWVSQNIFVSDLISAQGVLLSFSDVVYLKGATISLRDFNKVINLTQ